MNRVVVFLMMLLTWAACTDLTNIKDVNVTGGNTTVAIPILNSGLNIVDLGNSINNQTYVEVLTDGKLVVHYDGKENRQEALNVLPPFPIVNPETFVPIYWPMPDTNYQLSISLITDIFSEDDDIIVKKSTYKDNNLIFDFSSQFDEEIIVEMKVPGMFKEEVEFVHTFVLPANVKNFLTDKLPLNGWTLTSDNNIPFVYDARKQNGERVILEQVLVNMDNYSVSYTEGYFGQNRFALNADEIEIGVFKKWKSGGFLFEDPIIELSVENSFGFPVRAKVNYINLTTITDDVINLESDFLSQMDFDYPSIAERGEVVPTKFTFHKDNSNVKDLFNTKVKKFSYHVEASANPTGDNSIIGFMDSSSFFKIFTTVILPLEMNINELVLVDTFDLDLSKQEIDVEHAQLKFVNQNKMPFDINLQAYFVNENGVAIDSMFEDGLQMPAGEIAVDGSVVPLAERIDFIEIDGDRYDELKVATNIVLEVNVNSDNTTGNGSVWLTDQNGLDSKLGLIAEIKND